MNGTLCPQRALSADATLDCDNDSTFVQCPLQNRNGGGGGKRENYWTVERLKASLAFIFLRCMANVSRNTSIS
jgi:hypothetical protein